MHALKSRSLHRVVSKDLGVERQLSSRLCRTDRCFPGHQLVVGAGACGDRTVHSCRAYLSAATLHRVVGGVWQAAGWHVLELWTASLALLLLLCVCG